MAEQFANRASSIITSAMLVTDTTLTVQNAVPFPTIPQFRLLIDNELMLCTAVAGNVFTVTRGIEGTVAAAHANFSPIILPLTAGSIQNLPAGPTGPQGPSGAVLDILPEAPISGNYILTSTDGILQWLPYESEV